MLFLSSFIFDKWSASLPASTSSPVARSSNARIGSSIREATFSRGVIMKPTSSSVRYFESMFIFARSFCNPDEETSLKLSDQNMPELYSRPKAEPYRRGSLIRHVEHPFFSAFLCLKIFSILFINPSQI